LAAGVKSEFSHGRRSLESVRTPAESAADIAIPAQQPARVCYKATKPNSSSGGDEEKMMKKRKRIRQKNPHQRTNSSGTYLLTGLRRRKVVENLGLASMSKLRRTRKSGGISKTSG